MVRYRPVWSDKVRYFVIDVDVLVVVFIAIVHGHVVVVIIGPENLTLKC